MYSGSACRSMFVRNLFRRNLFRLLQFRVSSHRSHNTFISSACLTGKACTSPVNTALACGDNWITSFARNMATSSDGLTDLLPPQHVRGMKKLDKDAFRKTVTVPSLVVPAGCVNALQKVWKKVLLKLPGLKPICDLSSEDTKHKRVLLHPENIQSIDDLPVTKEELKKLSIDASNFETAEVELTYENWTYDALLSAILPMESDGIGGFSMIGHIAHLNLREENMEFKDIIGQVILDKVKLITTVVNKVGTIDNTYRNFQMEVLAGDNNFITTQKEHGISFEFDFSTVYWNSRLGTEHRRVVSLLKSGDVVYDVFAGVGPFAVPAAKKRCEVYANDLNPDSYKWLNHNIKLNRVKTELSTHNLDGRDFIRSVVKPDIIKRWQADEDQNYEISVVMNLPALAIEFLDAFRGLLTGADRKTFARVVLPTVYCYCFSSEEDSFADAKSRVECVLGEPLADGYDIFMVRNVAPKKDMLCVTFTLTESVLYGEIKDQGSTEGEVHENGPPEKRHKTAS